MLHLKTRKNLKSMESIAELYNIEVMAYSSEEQLNGLSNDEMLSLNEQIEIYYNLFKNVIIDPQEPVVDKDKRLLSSALEALELSPLGDIGPYINGVDVVEIYTANLTQLYRNLAFLRYCSYDLLSLYTRPFHELYSRSDKATNELMAFFGKAFASKGIMQVDVEPHLLKEKFLDGKKVFKLSPRVSFPLVNQDNEVAAVLVTSACEEYTIGPVSLPEPTSH